MKKVLSYSLVGLLVLVIAVYVVLQFFLGDIVKKSVNTYGPQITQTKLVLEGAKISPLSGVGTLTGLVVGNPAGWSSADAVKLGRAHLDVEPFSLMKDHIVINELVIEKPEINYESRLVASNIGDLMKNVEKPSGASEPQPKTKDGKPVKLVVKKLVLKDAQVTVSVAGRTVLVPMPQIDMTDVGVKEGGVSPTQLAVAVMRHITPQIVAAATKEMAKLGGASGAAAETVKQAGEAIKGLFGGEKKK